MAESFLEEQLKRIKEMTEQMSRIRAFRDTHEVRHHPVAERGSVVDETRPPRRPTPDDPSPRRRRRR